MFSFGQTSKVDTDQRCSGTSSRTMLTSSTLCSPKPRSRGRDHHRTPKFCYLAIVALLCSHSLYDVLYIYCITITILSQTCSSLMCSSEASHEDESPNPGSEDHHLSLEVHPSLRKDDWSICRLKSPINGDTCNQQRYKDAREWCSTYHRPWTYPTRKEKSVLVDRDASNRRRSSSHTARAQYFAVTRNTRICHPKNINT